MRVFKLPGLFFSSLKQRSPIQSKMCGSKKTFGSLILLCCLFLTECRVLKFVVAVSLPLFVSVRLIHWAIIWATSHQMTVALLCIVADYTRFFCSLSIVTFTHLHHKGLLWAPNTASHISDRHFVHKPLCISFCYTSSTMEIQWNAIWGFKTQVRNASFHKEVSFHSGCLSRSHITLVRLLKVTRHYVVTGNFQFNVDYRLRVFALAINSTIKLYVLIFTWYVQIKIGILFSVAWFGLVRTNLQEYCLLAILGLAFSWGFAAVIHT